MDSKVICVVSDKVVFSFQAIIVHRPFNKHAHAACKELISVRGYRAGSQLDQS